MNTSQHKETAQAVFNQVVSVLNNRTSKISKAFLSLLMLVILSFQTYGQDESWTLLKEENGVTVYYQIAQCDSQVSDDPLDMLESNAIDEILKLKLVNGSAEVKSVTYAKVTKTDDGDELETIEIGVGTTIVETCQASPKIILTKQVGDNYPVAINDFLGEFSLTINQ